MESPNRIRSVPGTIISPVETDETDEYKRSSKPIWRDLPSLDILYKKGDKLPPFDFGDIVEESGNTNGYYFYHDPSENKLYLTDKLRESSQVE